MRHGTYYSGYVVVDTNHMFHMYDEILVNDIIYNQTYRNDSLMAGAPNLPVLSFSLPVENEGTVFGVDTLHTNMGNLNVDEIFTIMTTLDEWLFNLPFLQKDSSPSERDLGM